MKKTLIHIGILAGVFVLAVIAFSYITNGGNTDMTADMSAPTLPRIAFDATGYGKDAVNPLDGYVTQMQLTTMRDTITPTPSNGKLIAQIVDYNKNITGLTYKVYSLDGTKTYTKGKIKKLEKTVELDVGTSLPDGQEGVLEIVLNTDGEKKIYYYTRIVNPTDFSLLECIGFIEDFHTKTFNKTDAKGLMASMEADDKGDNTTFQTVSIHSDFEHLSWGSLKPQIVGDVQWSIVESNTVYTSVRLDYKVSCTGETDEAENYNVKEFFKVRKSEDKIYLLDYQRTMNQLFDGTKHVVSEKGLNLGIVPPDVEYMTNKDGTIVSFVQERELWNYNKEEDQLSLVFSFASSENQDPRNTYDQHDVHIINVENTGSTVFTVCGYMNRGKHEGEVGVAVYYFDIEKNAVEEKAFIPSDKSYPVVEDEFGKLVNYNNKQDVLYVMVDGTLYKNDLKEEKQEILVKGLETSQYVGSDDGKLLAYQTDGKLNEATKAAVLNLTTGKSYEVKVEKDECIRPLGFINHDFVYGVAKQADAGTTMSGDTVTPMYKLEIRNIKNKVVKTYQTDQIYILDILIDSNMITVNRVSKNGNTYTSINQDYITSNAEKAKSNITMESFTTELKETQMRLAYEDGISDKEPKLLSPKQVLYENPTTVAFDRDNKNLRYYVYGRGGLVAIYDKAGYAIQKADEVLGVVVSSTQDYIWERGNRNLQYSIEDMAPYADMSQRIGAGEAPLTVLNEFSDEMAMDLTGCTVEQMFYVIGRGTPVVALTDSAHAIILVGYTTSTVTYVEPSTGERKSMPITELEEQVKNTGNTFIGYVKSKS